MIRIALVGQPNSGKSTIFNHLVGYKAKTSNLPGTTVEYLKSEALIGGKRLASIPLLHLIKRRPKRAISFLMDRLTLY